MAPNAFVAVWATQNAITITITILIYKTVKKYRETGMQYWEEHDMAAATWSKGVNYCVKCAEKITQTHKSRR
jgi:hypothetical protein